MDMERKFSNRKKFKTNSILLEEKQSNVFDERKGEATRAANGSYIMSDNLLETSDKTRADLVVSLEDRLLHQIGQIPLVVQEIFNHLPMRDLNSCERVCKMWHTVIQSTKKNRRQFSWMFWTGECGESQFNNHISSVLRQTLSRPKTAILFASNACLFERRTKYKTHRLIGSTSVSDSPLVGNLMAELPHDCQLLGVSADRVTGPRISSKRNTCAFTCCLLPEVPGVDIHSFVIDGARDPCGLTFHMLNILPVHAKVKCMIVFGSPSEGFINNAFAQVMLKKHNFALGGGNGLTLVGPRHIPQNAVGFDIEYMIPSYKIGIEWI